MPSKIQNQSRSVNSSGALLDDAARGAIHLDALRERVGQRELLRLLPERRVVAPRKAVVQDDEVTDALELVADERRCSSQYWRGQTACPESDRAD